MNEIILSCLSMLLQAYGAGNEESAISALEHITYEMKRYEGELDPKRLILKVGEKIGEILTVDED